MCTPRAPSPVGLALLALVLLAVASLPGALLAQEQLRSDVQAYAQTTPRMSTRIAWFSRTGSPGQLCIQYGQPTWKSDYDSKLDQAKGKSLRLGSDFWTSLDTSVDLTIGGTAVPAGQWYLGLACSDDGQWSLMVMEAAKVREHKADAFVTQRLKAKIQAPLRHAAAEQQTDKLSIELTDEPGKVGHGALRIAWGKHQLTAPIVADLKPPPQPPANASAAGKAGSESERAASEKSKGGDAADAAAAKKGGAAGKTKG